MTTTIPLQGGNTQLSYALEVTDPIIAGGGIAMTLVASNATGDVIVCQSIELDFPEGTNATDLIAGGAAINTQEGNWTVQKDSGTVTFTAPDGGVSVGGQALTFTLQTTANASPGTANVLLTEKASDPPGGSQTGTGTFSLSKFPVDFSLSDLTTATTAGLDVPYGTSAMLSWIATGTGVSCSLDYQPADSGGTVSQSVPNASPADGFRTYVLTRNGSVTFTLVAQVSVPGRDNPLVATRQCTVSVEAMSLSFVVEPPAVGVNGLVRLTWDAPNADHCELQDGTVLSASGTRYVLLQTSQSFTMTAYGADGQTLQQGATVDVSSSIVPNGTGFVMTGQTGPAGPDAVVHYGRNTEGGMFVKYIDPPGGGQPGQNVDYAPALPPLDTTTNPARVLPITVTGGTGGAGGAGAYYVAQAGGGPGGNAVLAATFDPSQTQPAQFIVTVAGGAGGGGSSQGAAGSASATIDGIALPLGGAALTGRAELREQEVEEKVMRKE